MGGIAFPNFNALGGLMQMDRQAERDRFDRERADRNDQWLHEDRKDARDLQRQTALAGLDEKKRKQLHDAAEWSGHAAEAVLSADPTQKQAVLDAMLADGEQRGYGEYLKNFPKVYSQGMDGQLHFYAMKSQEYRKGQADRPQPMGQVGGAPAPGGAPSGSDLDRSGTAISGIESVGGPNNGYGAVGPVANKDGNRAYGKHQVMDFNIGPWTQEVFGKPMTPQEFLANPQAQDAVFKHKFGQYIQQYGSPEAASRAWFAGPGGMNNPNASDVNGMTVAKYGQKFNAGFGGPQVADAGGFTPTNTPAQSVPGGLPQVAQGDARGTGQGDVRTPPGATPDPVFELRSWVHQNFPGGRPYADKQGNPISDPHTGLMPILMPNGQKILVRPPPKDAAPPSGYRPSSGGLEPIPGGPADPTRQKADAVPQGYTLAPGGGLAFIPGGPADPEVIKRNSEVKKTASEKAIPQTVVKGMQENLDALKQVDRAVAALKERPDSVGGVGSTAASIIPGVGNLQNRYGDPEGTQLRALIADIGSLKIHDRSGAAVTASETPRLRPFIPSISDDPKTVETKLNNFRAVYEQSLRDTADYYNADNGFKAHGPTESYLGGGASPSAPAAPPTTGAQGPKMSPEEAAKLPPGTPFIGLDGQPYVRN